MLNITRYTTYNYKQLHTHTMSLRGLQLDYPLFVAEFLDKDHVIVGGGGGEGNHGIPNKLVSTAGRWDLDIAVAS